ncbi:hypothetical protein Tsubulata_010576 [Turnera subulata]|uniref:DUF4283 domain-containing protein n=1 Tax=Turnera subulata TaxID=218843 RepID=A0A9Q0G8H0_9ROSI|nr:hypothetical protein Tsubulata_010576 [Turnera subulata]
MFQPNEGKRSVPFPDTDAAMTSPEPPADDRSTKKVRIREDPTLRDSPMEESSMSYRDKLTTGPTVGLEDAAWFEEEEAEYEDGDIRVVDGENGPEVELSDAFITRLKKPWKRAVVFKVLGRNIGYQTLKTKLQILWKPTGPYQIIDLVNNYFVARFAHDVDYENVLLNGPWVVYGNAIYVQPWSDDFRPTTDKIKHVVVWVQFPDYPLGRYHTRILKTLANLVGRTVKIDSNTAQSKRGKFAKVAVAVDLSKPLKDAVYLQKEKIRVSYEGLPPICQNCGLIGHNPVLCLLIPPAPAQPQQAPASPTPANPGVRDVPPIPAPAPVTSQPAEIPKPLGDWVNVPIKTSRPIKKSTDPRAVNHNIRDGASGSRFVALADNHALNLGTPPHDPNQTFMTPNPHQFSLRLNESQHSTIVNAAPPSTTIYRKPTHPEHQLYTQPSHSRNSGIPIKPPDPGDHLPTTPLASDLSPTRAHQLPPPASAQFGIANETIHPMDYETTTTIGAPDIVMITAEEGSMGGAPSS